VKHIKPIFEFVYSGILSMEEKSNLQSLYDEIKSIAYLLEDENLQVYVNIIDIKIEIVYKSVDSVTGKQLQNRMDAIQEFYDRCMELCDKYNFRFSSRDIDSGHRNKTKLITIIPNSKAFLESSRIISYDSYVENICKLDEEEIENIFQDVLDEFPLMDMKIDSIPVFSTEEHPVMISLMVDKNFYIKSERENGVEVGTMLSVLDSIKDNFLEQIDGRLEDHGLKIRDIRLVRIGSFTIFRKYHDSHIVIRIDRI